MGGRLWRMNDGRWSSKDRLKATNHGTTQIRHFTFQHAISLAFERLTKVISIFPVIWPLIIAWFTATFIILLHNTTVMMLHKIRSVESNSAHNFFTSHFAMLSVVVWVARDLCEMRDSEMFQIIVTNPLGSDNRGESVEVRCREFHAFRAEIFVYLNDSLKIRLALEGIRPGLQEQMNSYFRKKKLSRLPCNFYAEAEFSRIKFLFQRISRRTYASNFFLL